MSQIAAVKICVACSADVSGVKRIKDKEGRYYCRACWDDYVASAPPPETSTSSFTAAPAKAPAYRCSLCNVGLSQNALSYTPNGDIACAACARQACDNFDRQACSQCGDMHPPADLIEKKGQMVCPACAAKKAAPLAPRRQVITTSSSSNSRSRAGWVWGGGISGFGVFCIILKIVYYSLRIASNSTTPTPQPQADFTFQQPAPPTVAPPMPAPPKVMPFAPGIVHR